MRRLEREHFRGLAELVADADEWLHRIHFLLGEWKKSVHAGTAPSIEPWLEAEVLPGRLVVSLRRFRIGLGRSRDLFDSLLFMQLTGPDVPGPDLIDWFGRHLDPLDRLLPGCPGMTPSLAHDAARILFLTRDEVPATLQSTILDVLIEPAIWRIEPDHHSLREALFEGIGSIGKDVVLPATAANASFGATMIGLPRRLLALSRDRRAAIASLLATATPDRLSDTVRAAAAHQKRSAAILRDCIKEVEHTPPGVRGMVTRDSRVRHAGLVDRTREEWTIAGLLRSLDTLLDCSATAEQVVALQRLLEWIEGESSCLLQRWMPTRDNRAFVNNAARLGDLFRRRGVHPSIVAAIERANETDYVRDPINQIARCPDGSTCAAVLALVERMIYDAAWEPTGAIIDGLAALASGLGDVDIAESVAQRLGPRGVTWCKRATLAPIVRLTTTAEEVVSLMAIAADEESSSVLDTLATQFTAPEARALVVRTGVRGDWHLLWQWAQAIRMAKVAGVAWPSRPIAPLHADHGVPWAGNHAPELGEAILRLAAASDDAERITAAAAARLFADPVALRTEVAAIDALLARSPPEETRVRLLTRRGRLIDRAEGREPPRPGTVAKVLASLQRRADEAVVRASIEEARERLRGRLARLSGGCHVDDSVFAPPLVDLIAGLLTLSGRVRSVGLRLLLDRAGGNVFDPLGEPANRRYVERITARGIDIGPWLDGRIETRGTTATGEEFFVRFSDDVVDVMLMGHHFNTCLSPDGTNFFSVVTNAVDVNKRVAYGKTRAGRIVGRSLCALTDDGLVMPFFAYSHEGDFRFGAATDAFINALAAAMGTFVTAQGTVSPLVLSDWYHDRARSVPGERNFEAEEGLVARVFAGADPERILEEVATLLGGKDRLRDSLQRILELPTLQSRPELLPAFADAFGADPSVPATTRLSIAMACRRQGDASRADHLLSSLPAAVIITTLAEAFCPERRAFSDFDDSLEAIMEWMLAARPAILPRLITRLARRVKQEEDCLWPPQRHDMIATLARFRAAARRSSGG